MRTSFLVMLALVMSASLCRAGEVFGTISENNKPVGEGIKVEVTASGKLYTVETDKFGSYRFFVKEKGKASLSVTANDQSAKATIFSYEKSTRYDWVLETKDGKLSIRRK